MMRACGDCHGANRCLGEQISEIRDSAERGRRILLGWDGGRYSQRGRSPLEQAGHPPSARAAVFTGRCAPCVTPSRLSQLRLRFGVPFLGFRPARLIHGYGQKMMAYIKGAYIRLCSRNPGVFSSN